MGPHPHFDDQHKDDWVMGQRLILRPLHAHDRDNMAAGLGDYQVSQMTGTIPHPFTRFHAEIFIMMMRARRHCRGDHVWAICEPDRPEHLIGVMGLHPGKKQSWEIGYWLAPEAWGKGYATEAAQLAISFARDNGLKNIHAGYYADNPASGRVLAKLGFVHQSEDNLFSMARGHKAPGIRVYLPDSAA